MTKVNKGWAIPLEKEKKIKKCHNSHDMSLIVAFVKSQKQGYQPQVFRYWELIGKGW